ncbi:MAG: allophanate hydrolase [Hyphomicrobiales bacterium]|nr:allophanate hydrolase [Hyphomicrobiales bacterium]
MGSAGRVSRGGGGSVSEIFFDLKRLSAAYAGGLSPREVIETALARLAASGDNGIFIHVADKAALLDEAEALGRHDPARPLWGVPFAVKDNIDVAGMPTTAACPQFAYQAERDAVVVARLRAAGAIPLGKTNMDQFATGLSGVRTPYPIPVNPIDSRLVPGGSSSGSAVAVARGIVSFALGTDTAGSGRVPAGLNNIVGLKPSFGAISTTGVVPACRTLDCVTLLALTVDDAFAAFAIAADYDDSDSYARAFRQQPYPTEELRLRVGVPRRQDRRFFGDKAMASSFDQALVQLQEIGCTLVELPFADYYATAELLYGAAWAAERYSAIRDFYEARADVLHPVVHEIYAKARAMSAADAFSGFYKLQAHKRNIGRLMASFDVLCVPTAPIHGTLADLEREPVAANSRLGTYTNFANLLDLCAVAVPGPWRSDHLPFSITLLAAAGGDARIASLARRFHAASAVSLGATGWPQPETPPATPEADPGIPLLVVGAHMSGMPLNSELLALGGRFEREVTTAPLYRLYALRDQVQPKPGLLRVAADEGSAIDGEIWRLPVQGLGELTAAVPAPLGIATIKLADGSSIKGFAVEAAGIQGAADISAYGGWRAYSLQTQPV